MTLKDKLNIGDRFAAYNGMQLTDIKPGYGKAEMTVSENHLNGGGVCQGGALFTLADLAMAAALNSHGTMTFGIQNSISFVKSAMLGDHLTAEATEVLDHHKLPYINATVRNQDGDIIAIVSGMGYRKKDEFQFDTLI